MTADRRPGPNLGGLRAARHPALAIVAGLLLSIAAMAPAAAQEQEDHSGHGAPDRTGSGGGASAEPVTVDAPSRAAASGELARLLRAAPDGATVVVPPGVHPGPVVLDRPVTLDGGGRAVIDGGGAGTVLIVRAAGAVVTGLEIRGSGVGPVDAPTGVLVEADHVHVHHNVISDVYHGVAVQGADGVQVHDNVITGRGGAARAQVHLADHDTPTSGPGDGVSLWDATAALVRDNHISDVRDGIYLSFGREILVDRNTVTASRFGVHHMYTADLTVSENRFERCSAGLVVMYGGPLFALRNVILDNRSSATGYGILVKDVGGVRLVENVVARNRVGIQVEAVPSGVDDRAEIIRNTIAANQTALMLAPSIYAGIGGNSFIDNPVALAFTGGRGDPDIEWLYRSAGNYWSDYQGVDGDGDGIGERPHPIGGAVERLLSRSPQLGGLTGSAAMQVLHTLEERFGLATPLATDQRPLVRPLSPALPPAGDDGSSPLTAALAGAVLSGSVAAWHLLRRPRTNRGLPHAIA